MTAPLRRLLPLPVVAALGLGTALVPAVAASARATASVAVRQVSMPDPAVGLRSGFVRLPQFRLHPAPGMKVTVAPSSYSGFSVRLSSIEATLAKAPTQAQVSRGAQPLAFSVPAPDGTMQRFAVAEDSVMQPGLQAAHPEIRTYAGRSLSGTPESIRLDTSPLGFHASVDSPGGGPSWYVDPAYVGRGVTSHISYYGDSVPADSTPFVDREIAGEMRAASAAPAVATTAGGVVTRRTYRMAFVTDPTYAAYFGTANVLAAKAALINRTDQVYNDDLAIKFVLIDGTDKLNLDTKAAATLPNGPCGADACYDPDFFYSDGTVTNGVPDAPDGCTGDLLDRNNFVLGQLVGADTFDIGHIGLGVNGGGVASLGVVGSSSKAQGCTGVPKPTGDFYAIDYFAHEVGHEMGANHPFNGTQAACASSNRNAGTSVEPGSGTSIMAYAGICGSDNLQPHSDPYFSQRSIDEITSTTSATPGSADEVQVVTLAGFDTDGDSFTLNFPGAKAPITITRGTRYRALLVQQQIATLTGCQVTLGDYDGGTAAVNISDNGFTVKFNNPTDCSGTDEPRLVIGGFTGGVTGFIGVTTNGGDDTNSGITQTVTTDHAPVVTAPADKTIPIRTPFTLSGSGTDSDGDKLVYLWEQNDVGGTNGTGLVDNNKTNGPLFRVFGTYAPVTADGTLTTPSPGENLATDSASRTFPDMAQVLADNTNAETGSCPSAGATLPVPLPIVDCYSEFLPTAAYGSPGGGLPSPTTPTLDFRLTARDLSPTGGGTAYDDVALTLSTAGPFAVTSRSTAGTAAAAGGTETVTWAVNGTNTAALAQNVKISLSTDGGQTFPFVLAATTPNDGSQDVTLPQVSTAHARIKVEAVGNYFFDTNDADFKIIGPLTVTNAGTGTVQYSDVLSGVTVTASSSHVDGGQLVASVKGLDGVQLGVPVTSPAGESPSTAAYPVVGTITSPPGTYPVTVTVTEPANASGPATIQSTTFNVVVTAEDATVTYAGPTAVKSGKTPGTVPLKATVVDNADGNPGLITKATVTFVNRATKGTLCTAPVTGGPTNGTATCNASLPATTGAGTSYKIGMVVGGAYQRDSAADDATVTVTKVAGDVTPPDTTITAGPRDNSFVRAPQAVFRETSTESPASFSCRLDGTALSCGTSVRTPVLTPGHTYLLKVAALDGSLNLDKTPATRQFAAPFTVDQLTASGGWTKGTDPAAYRGIFLSTKQAGETLSKQAAGVTKVSLVYTQLPRGGRVGVYLGGQLLRIVDTTGPRTKLRVLVLTKQFATPTTGRFTVKSLDDKPVKVEGLGLLRPHT